jgi:hypothetical protein
MMARADDRRPITDIEAEGMPEVDEQPPGVDDETAVEAVVPPWDAPMAAGGYGTTAAEQLRGESFADRTRREQPDVLIGSEPRPGRLVQPDQGWILEPDDEPAEVADEVKEDTVGLSAEEAAEHVVEFP